MGPVCHVHNNQLTKRCQAAWQSVEKVALHARPDACLRAPHRQAARMDFFNGLSGHLRSMDRGAGRSTPPDPGLTVNDAGIMMGCGRPAGHSGPGAVQCKGKRTDPFRGNHP